MNNLIRKKVILCLLDCVPKSTGDIANEIGESLAVTEDYLTELVSENICESVSKDEASRWIIKRDIGTFEKLVKGFLSNAENSYEEVSQFVTSKYYHDRIDNLLVSHVLARFHLDSVYRTDEERVGLRRLLLASPSALLHVLNADAQIFDEMRSSQNQLDTSDSTREWFGQILVSQFQTPILDMLRADMNSPAFAKLHAVLGLRAAKINMNVSLATLHGKYVEAVGGGSYSLGRAMEALRAGQLASNVDPMAIVNDGLAFLHLEEFQAALEHFDKALAMLQDPIQKAKVWNNKGVTFLLIKQYQKAVGCFEEGIKYHSENDVPQLRENIQLASEYLDRATDADNLNEPTQIRFVQGYPVPFEETLFYEFKEITGSNPVLPITKHSNEYAVAFLNREGGRIFWGIRDSDRVTIGVMLNEQQRNETRTKVSEKLGAIQPSISVEHWQLEFHNVYDLQGKTVEDFWVIELVIPPPQERDVFYTGSSDLFVKTEGGRQKLRGQQITEFILGHMQNDSETN